MTWEAVRRALGRLSMRATVHGVSTTAALPETFTLPLNSGPEICPGRAETNWRPDAKLSAFNLPGENAVVADVDLADVPVAICSDAALASTQTQSVPIVFSEMASRCHAARILEASPPVRTMELASPAGMGHAVSLIAAPRCGALPIASLNAPRRHRCDLRVGGGRMRASLSTLARVPCTRARLPLPPGGSRDAAWLAERQKLAAAAAAPLDDVRLIGVFPRVPVGAVRSLALAEDGAALHFWLKPDALGGPTPRLVTLILGQRRSNGAAIRAVA